MVPDGGGGIPLSIGDTGTGAGIVGNYDHDPLIDELGRRGWTSTATPRSSRSPTTESDFGDLDEIHHQTFEDLDTKQWRRRPVIDINVDSDFLLNNYDWILDGDGNTFAIFRVRGNTNMIMSNSSIGLGPSGVGGPINPTTGGIGQLGAIFVQYQEPKDNTDEVFNFDNVILNGVGFWDLNAFQGGCLRRQREHRTRHPERTGMLSVHQQFCNSHEQRPLDALRRGEEPRCRNPPCSVWSPSGSRQRRFAAEIAGVSSPKNRPRNVLQSVVRRGGLKPPLLFSGPSRASCRGVAVAYHSRLSLSLVAGPFLAALVAAPGAALAQDAPSEPQGLLREPPAIERVVVFADRRQGNGELTNGYYIDFANMIPGAGWLSAGPGWRQWYAPRQPVRRHVGRHVVARLQDGAGEGRAAQTRGSRLAVGSQLRLQDFTQVAYYGEGPDSLESNASEYRLTSKNLVGYATFRPVQWIGIGGSIGWLKPNVRERAGFFERDRPGTEELFPDDVVFAQPEQPAFVHGEASITADTRDFPGHPTRGGLYRAAAANYSDRDGGLFSFRRYEAEGAQFIPLADSRVVIALHGWLVGVRYGRGRAVPFYLQPSLGGHDSLRSSTPTVFTIAI